jgi:hypothetical protein
VPNLASDKEAGLKTIMYFQITSKITMFTVKILSELSLSFSTIIFENSLICFELAPPLVEVDYLTKKAREKGFLFKS